MKTHEFTGGEKLSTSEQARALLIQVGSTAVQKGEKLYERYSFVVDDIETPAVVREHMPQADIGSFRAYDSVDVQWLFDGKTGEQKEAGIIGIVSFIHCEEVEEGVAHKTHVNYNIYLRSADDYTVERLIHYTEHDTNKTRRSLAQTTGGVAPLAAWTDLKDSASMPIVAQRKFGHLDVSETEAHEVTEFVSNL